MKNPAMDKRSARIPNVCLYGNFLAQLNGGRFQRDLNKAERDGSLGIFTFLNMLTTYLLEPLLTDYHSLYLVPGRVVHQPAHEVPDPVQPGDAHDPYLLLRLFTKVQRH